MTKKPVWNILRYFALLVVGNALFSLGFNLFLVPNSLNVGGLSGIAMILQRVLGKGGIGFYSAVMNVPLFVIGYKQLGRGFFFGSLIGMACNALFIDLLAGIPAPQVETMLGVIFGGVLTGAGIGLVFLPGATTGGTDILARLLKRHLREIKMGYVTLTIDTCVLILTGLVFRDISKTLYSAITLFICSRVLDAVLYGLDYSRGTHYFGPVRGRVPRDRQAAGPRRDVFRRTRRLYGRAEDGFNDGGQEPADLRAQASRAVHRPERVHDRPACASGAGRGLQTV